MRTLLRKFGEFIWQQLLVSCVVGALILWQQIKRGIISPPRVEDNWLAFLVPYIWLLTGLVVWHLCRTAYLLHLEDRAEIERLQPNAGSTNDELHEIIPAVTQFSPRQVLHNAEEAVWVEDALKRSKADLKIDIAHDAEFRERFYALPKSKYLQIDNLRETLKNDPIFTVGYVRTHLVSRQILAGMIDQLMASMNKPYLSTVDFLFELSIVNVTNNTASIERFEMEAEIEGTWTKLELGRLEDYSLAFDEETAYHGSTNKKTTETLLEPALATGLPGNLYQRDC